jgi:uncharacterized protein
MPLSPLSPSGCRILLHVVPRASRTQLCGVYDGCLKLQVAAPPVDGEANDAIIRFFSKLLKIERARVTLTSGEASKRKCIEISGIPPDELPSLRSRLGLP